MSIQQSLKDRAKRETKPFEIPGVGTVLIQSLTVGERQAYFDGAEEIKESGTATRIYENAYSILSRAVVDPETGTLPFAGEEGRALYFGITNEAVHEALFALANECLTFNGIGVKESKAEGKGDSDAGGPSTS